jgi:predicted flap endonuclease-1-like 5' DNA nuclease
MGQRRFWFVDEIEEFEAKARGSTRAVESRPLLPKQFSREELISSLALIPQVENRLADHGILLVQQLEQWQAHELASLNGIGFKTIVDIQQALAMRQPPLMLNFKKP